MRLATFVILAAAAMSCGSNGGPPPPPTPAAEPLEGPPLLVSSNLVAISPEARDAAALDLARLGIDLDDVDGTFVLTTPADTAFAFTLTTAGERATRVAIAHVAEAGAVPRNSDTPQSLTVAGFHYSGTDATPPHSPFGLAVPDPTPWYEATGDHGASIRLRGAVAQDQVLVARVGDGADENYALIFIEIGAASGIATVDSAPDDEVPLESYLLASGVNRHSGAPTIAGFETGPVALWFESEDDERFQVRLREGFSGTLGGAALAGAPPEHAAGESSDGLFLARASGTDLILEREFFGMLDPPQLIAGTEPARHPAIAAANGHRLAIAYWRGRELQLLVGDGPFDLPSTERSLHRAPEGAIPLPPALVWSEFGDLVIAYAYRTVQLETDLAPTAAATHYRCHFVPWDESGDADFAVATSALLGQRPAVAAVGGDETLRVFYVTETPAGLDLRESDTGRSFGAPLPFAAPGASFPRLLARAQATLKLDALYIQPTTRGRELHRTRWPDFDGAPPQESRLTRATLQRRSNGPAGTNLFPVYPGNIPVPWLGFDGSELGPYGFDAVVEGDVVLAVAHETQVVDFYMNPDPGREVNFISVGIPDPPPPLLPLPAVETLTEPLTVPSERFRERLRLFRLE